MQFQQLTRTDPDKVFVIGQNVSGSSLVGNTLVCFEGVNCATASLGVAIQDPITSNLNLFAGILDADLAANAYGLVQVYGFRASIAANVATNVSISCAGLILGAVAGQVSAHSNGKSWQLGPIIVYDNDKSGVGHVRGMIRAL